jgi:hypothetical protein
VASSPYAVTLASLNRANFEFGTISTATSGTGATIYNGPIASEQWTPNVLTAGYSVSYSGTGNFWSNGGTQNRLTFTSPVWISGKVLIASGYAGDANNSYRSYVGQTDTGGAPTGGDPISASIGIKFTGGASQVFQLMVHNGTTQTLVSGSTTIAANVVYDWMVYSDGAGNATLFINGAQEATTTNAPTATSNTTYFVQALSQTVTAATRMILEIRHGKVIVGN